MGYVGLATHLSNTGLKGYLGCDSWNWNEQSGPTRGVVQLILHPGRAGCWLWAHGGSQRTLSSSMSSTYNEPSPAAWLGFMPRCSLSHPCTYNIDTSWKLVTDAGCQAFTSWVKTQTSTRFPRSWYAQSSVRSGGLMKEFVPKVGWESAPSGQNIISMLGKTSKGMTECIKAFYIQLQPHSARRYSTLCWRVTSSILFILFSKFPERSQ